MIKSSKNDVTCVVWELFPSNFHYQTLCQGTLFGIVFTLIPWVSIKIVEGSYRNNSAVTRKLAMIEAFVADGLGTAEGLKGVRGIEVFR